jgi:hypothetical protein
MKFVVERVLFWVYLKILDCVIEIKLIDLKERERRV